MKTGPWIGLVVDSCHELPRMIFLLGDAVEQVLHRAQI
jgi:hypothetical protein